MPLTSYAAIKVSIPNVSLDIHTTRFCFVLLPEFLFPLFRLPLVMGWIAGVGTGDLFV